MNLQPPVVTPGTDPGAAGCHHTKRNFFNTSSRLSRNVPITVLVIDSDISADFPRGTQLTASALHWEEHGFLDGSMYAIELKSGQCYISSVSPLGDEIRLDSVHPALTINPSDVSVAALIQGVYESFPMPTPARQEVAQ